MSDKKFELLIKFKNVLMNFIDELVQQFPNDSDIVMCRIFIKDQIPTQTIMDKFIKYFTPQEELIKNKDPLFFTMGTSEFCSSLNLNTNIFEKVWFSGVLDDEDKEITWQWITSLYKIVDKYKTIP
jgi:hypothetical protein